MTNATETAQTPVFNIDRKELTEAIKLLKMTCDAQSTMPVFQAVKIETCDPWLVRLTTTTLGEQVQITLPVVEMVPGALLIDLATLNKLVKAKKTDSVTIRAVSKNGVEIDTTTAKNQIAVSDFPGALEMVPTSTVETNAIDYADRLARTLPFAALDETRYNLCGVYVAAGEIVAADGHRLHLVRDTKSHNLADGVVVPSNAIKALIAAVKADKGVHETLHIETSRETKDSAKNEQVRYTLGNVTVTARCVDGQFPDYTQVVPDTDDATTLFQASKKELSEAVKYVTTLSKGYACVTISVSDGQVLTRYKNEDVEAEHVTRASVVLGDIAPLKPDATEYEKERRFDDTERTTVVNAAYWREALKTMPGDDVLCYLDDKNGPLLLVDGDDTHVLMPART